MTTTTERYTAEQLREFAVLLDSGICSPVDVCLALNQAATRLQSLEAENAWLRGVISQIHALAIDPIRPFEETNDEIERIARNALKED